MLSQHAGWIFFFKSEASYKQQAHARDINKQLENPERAKNRYIRLEQQTRKLDINKKKDKGFGDQKRKKEKNYKILFEVNHTIFLLFDTTLRKKKS